MQKLVLKISMQDDDAKRKALKIVAALPGIDSISVDMKERKMTIIGTVDPTKVVSRLRKYWTTELLTVGPAKPAEEPKKADDVQPAAAAGGEKKQAATENEGKKDQEAEKKSAQVVAGDHQVGGGGGKKEGEKEDGKKNGDQVVVVVGEGREVKKVDPLVEMVSAHSHRAYNPNMSRYYYAQSIEENPNACVIC